MVYFSGDSPDAWHEVREHCEVEETMHGVVEVSSPGRGFLTLLQPSEPCELAVAVYDAKWKEVARTKCYRAKDRVLPLTLAPGPHHVVVFQPAHLLEGPKPLTVLLQLDAGLSGWHAGPLHESDRAALLAAGCSSQPAQKRGPLSVQEHLLPHLGRVLRVANQSGRLSAPAHVTVDFEECQAFSLAGSKEPVGKVEHTLTRGEKAATPPRFNA